MSRLQKTLRNDLSTWLLALVLLCAPLYVVRFHIKEIPFTLLEVILLIVCSGVIVQSVYRKQLSKQQRILLIFGFSLIAMSIFSLLVTPNVRIGLGIWKAYIVEPVLFSAAILLHIRTREQVQLLATSVAIAVVGVSLITIWQYVTGWGIPDPWNMWPDRRATAFFGYPNAIGLYIAPVVTGAAGVAMLRKKAYAAWGVFFVGCTALIAARVDGALIGSVAGIGIMLLTQRRFRWWTVGAGVVGLSAALVLPFTRSILLFQDTSGQVRLALWRGTWNLIAALPLYGAGLGGFPETYDLYRLPSHVELLLYPHNIFLNFWVELGISGLLWIVGLLFFLFFIICRNLRDKQWLALPLLGIWSCLVVYGMVDVIYFKNDLSLMFWLYAALVVLLPTIISGSDSTDRQQIEKMVY